MKITAVNIVDSNAINRKNYIKDKNNITNTINQTDLLRNSLSEAAGRSQVVSFHGLIDDSITNDFKKNLGLGDKISINFNKGTGDFIRTITRPDGSLKSREEYYPRLNKQIITTSDKTVTTQETKTPDGVYTIKRDNKNREIFYEEKLNNGQTYTVTTEYDKYRRIEEKLFNGERRSIKVIDIRTNEPVYSGKMVMKEVVIPEKGIKRIQNILTDAVYSEEKTKPNGTLLYFFKNYPETNIHSYLRAYNKQTGGYNETYFNENGKRTSLEKTSKNGKNVETYKFDNDGKTVLSHFEQIFSRHGDIETEIIYTDASKKIEKLTNYRGTKSDVYIYKNSPNVPEYADFYDAIGLYKHIDYQNDGKTFKHKIEYFNEGEIHETEYFTNGKTKKLSKQDDTGYTYEVSTYFTNGKIQTLTKFNKTDDTCVQEIYDNGERYPKQKLTQGADGKLTELISYYKGTKIPAETRKYHEDGSYRRILHDYQGNSVSEKEYYANGREKNYKTEGNNRNNSAFNHNTRRKPFIFVDIDMEDTAKPSKQTPDDQSLNNILNIAANNDMDINDISEYDWQVLSRLTGVDDIEELKTMNTKTYRPLAKKFHPDVNKDNPNIEQCNKIMTIINALYDRNKH